VKLNGQVILMQIMLSELWESSTRQEPR